MTEKRLAQYRYICRELEQLGKDIEKLRNKQLHDTVLTSDGPGYTLREITIRGDIARVKREKRVLRRKEERLIRERDAIEAFIESVEDSQMRQIIEFRFITETDNCRLLSWQAVASRMGWQDESTPRKKFENFMESRIPPKKVC